MAIRLFIADGEPVSRIGLASFLTAPDFKIAAEVDRAGELIQKASAESFDLILTDTAFSDGSGFDAVAQLRQNGYSGRILFFSSSSNETSFLRALSAGADSYLLKTVEPTTLIRTAKALADRGPRYEGENLGFFAGELDRYSHPIKNRARPRGVSPLTERQIQVLRCVAAGLGNKEIASVLKIKDDTVKEHIRNILRTLDVKDRTAAAVWAIRNRLIP